MLQVSKNLRWVTICIVSEYPLSPYFIFGVMYSSSKIAWTSESITTKSQEGAPSLMGLSSHNTVRMLCWGSRGTVDSLNPVTQEVPGLLFPFPNSCPQNSFLTYHWYFHCLLSCCPKSGLGNCQWRYSTCVVILGNKYVLDTLLSPLLKASHLSPRQSNPVRDILSLSPFYRWRHWGMERFSTLPRSQNWQWRKQESNLGSGSTIPQYYGPLWLTSTQNPVFLWGCICPPTDHMIWVELTTLPGESCYPVLAHQSHKLCWP